MIKLILLVSKGLVLDPEMRRKTMFRVALADIGIVAWGTLFLVGPDVNSFLFIVYWMGCAGLTLLMLMLAVYDWMVVRSKLAIERRRLQTEVLGSSLGKKKQK